MNTTDFAIWLSGFVELHGAKPNEKQWSAIVDHLNLALGKKLDFGPINKAVEEAKKQASIAGANGLRIPWSTPPENITFTQGGCQTC